MSDPSDPATPHASRTVLVTGASSGIGAATAERLLEQGYPVYVAARRVEKMRDLEARGATALEMDITDDADVRAVVDRIADERGGIDVLINNAGFGLYGAVEDVPVDEARYQFEVNLFGLARLTQLALPHMRERERGTIVNVSSMGGRIYFPLGAWYHASKHALEGWSDSLRVELEPFGIDVVVIQPGIIRTEFNDVTTGPMLEHSGDTAYRDTARRMADSIENSAGGPPSLVADTIARAVNARRPGTRYPTGPMARPLMTIRRLLGDRVFDWVLSRAI